jgi:hypothetical protein
MTQSSTSVDELLPPFPQFRRVVNRRATLHRRESRRLGEHSSIRVNLSKSSSPGKAGSVAVESSQCVGSYQAVRIFKKDRELSAPLVRCVCKGT